MAKTPTLKTEAFVKWFRAATPYIHQWGGSTFVIAFGGEVLADGEFQQLTHDINVLVSLEVRVVLVHGTRPQIEEQMRQHGVTPRPVEHGHPGADGEGPVAGGVVQGEARAVLGEDRGLQRPETAGVGLRDGSQHARGDMRGARSELTALPWVDHRSRAWEPEPLRWLGVNAGLRAMAVADVEERLTRRPSVVARALGPLIGGH